MAGEQMRQCTSKGPESLVHLWIQLFQLATKLKQIGGAQCGADTRGPFDGNRGGLAVGGATSSLLVNLGSIFVFSPSNQVDSVQY